MEKHGLPHDHLIRTGNEELPPELAASVLADEAALLAGEPLQYYLGKAEFCGFSLCAEPGVLIPRADTETLVEAALERLPQGGFFFDFCCGSGCVGIALALLRKDLSGVLFDLSDKALALSEKNLRLHGLEKRLTVEKLDVLSPAASDLVRREKPDLITANPPYLDGAEMRALPENVRREPETALYGGEDGLTFYRAFAGLVRETSVPLLAEIGYAQGKAVLSILKNAGLSGSIRPDAGGRDRVVSFDPKNLADPR
ncbi:MAG: peptide chain release factor N(5)-glutamine methyltransferase [Clostridia bacterium]|nr:peptide chain release factor N(5)-glutamine methyltransferase [Clostridia bacterium]